MLRVNRTKTYYYGNARMLVDEKMTMKNQTCTFENDIYSQLTRAF